MKVKINTLLDICFSLFIFTSIVMTASTIGKIIQLISITFILVFSFISKPKLTYYNILEFLFVIYVYIQVFFDIAIIKSVTFAVGNTVLYNFLFVLGIFNYCIKRKGFKEIINIYTYTTIFSLLLLLVIYHNTLFTFRFNTLDIIKVFNIKLIGGHSSTSLAIICAIASFFECITSKRGEQKQSIYKILLLLLISILTGTRKTLIIYLFIFFIAFPIKNEKVTIPKILNVLLKTIIIIIPLALLVFKIPILYNTIGYRIETAAIFFVNHDTATDDSLRVRNRMINQSVNLYKQKKIQGWGMDYFRGSNQNDLGYYSHNNFLEILTGGGIIGFLIYYSKYIYMFVSLLKLIIRDKEKQGIVFSCLLFFIIMIILEYWQVTYIYRFIIIYQAFLLAMIYYAKNNISLYKEKNT